MTSSLSNTTTQLGLGTLTPVGQPLVLAHRPVVASTKGYHHFPRCSRALGILSASRREPPNVGHILEMDASWGEGKASPTVLSPKLSSAASRLLPLDVTVLDLALPIPGSAGG